MRSLRYLNSVLTVIAVLLTLNLYTLWTTSPASIETVPTAQAAGLPDGGAQRKEMIDQLKLLNQKFDQLTQLLKSGEARVRIEGATDKN
ncbi:MAG: hypothetical protein GC164_01835 [Phycisphaera sp.]|nr:hypothetical protein [Phycisphaera sp.]